MIEQIYSKSNLILAFYRVKKNKGCAGIDKTSIEQYGNNLERNVLELHRLLKEGTYQPLPVKRTYIPKPNGKQRPLGIPAVKDRVVQQAMLQVLQPLFEPLFSDASYGFRPNRNPIQAVRKVQEYLEQGYEYIVDADIEDFFGTISHRTLMNKIRETVKDRAIARLIWKFLKAGIMEEGKIRYQTTGTPQGGIISPLLANLYLNSFDHKIDNAGWKLVRYADDWVILASSVNQAIHALKTARSILKKLKLTLSAEKTRISEHSIGFDFLGYHFQRHYGGNYKWPSNKSIQAFKDKIRHRTRRQQPRNIAQIIPMTNPLIRGWGHYFKYGNVKNRFKELDGWIRMRLRSFIEKKKWSQNWKYPNDHFNKLGLVSLTELATKHEQLFFPTFGQPYRRAVCGKSARTVR